MSRNRLALFAASAMATALSMAATAAPARQQPSRPPQRSKRDPGTGMNLHNRYMRRQHFPGLGRRAADRVLGSIIRFSRSLEGHVTFPNAT